MSDQGVEPGTFYSSSVLNPIGQTKEQKKNIKRNVQKKENEENFLEESIISAGKMNMNK